MKPPRDPAVARRAPAAAPPEALRGDTRERPRGWNVELRLPPRLPSTGFACRNVLDVPPPAALLPDERVVRLPVTGRGRLKRREDDPWPLVSALTRERPRGTKPPRVPAVFVGAPRPDLVPAARVWLELNPELRPKREPEFPPVDTVGLEALDVPGVEPARAPRSKRRQFVEAAP